MRLALIDTDDCSLYTETCANQPYAAIGRGLYAHTFVCLVFHGDRPGMTHQWHAAHSCGQSRCVNPRHIRWATVRENVADKIRHGTHRRGEDMPWSKLTEDDVREIRRVYAEGGISQAALGERYGVRPSNIQLIVAGKIWKHVA